MEAGAHQSKIAALVLLVLGLAFYLSFALGEIAAGDITGIQHLLPAAILAVLLVIVSRHPRRAGIALLVLAIPFAIAYTTLLAVRDLPFALDAHRGTAARRDQSAPPACRAIRPLAPDPVAGLCGRGT